MPCNGAAISRTDYPDLFSAIGTAWGNGDGTTTFNVPDLRDRALYGIGSVVSLAGTDGRSMGSRGGPAHHHTQVGNTNPNGSHTHTVGTIGDHAHGLASPLTGTVQNAINAADAAGVLGAGTLSTTQNAGGHNHSLNTVSDHVHALSGSTSGGGDLDKPSFAGVQHAITTGRSGT